MVNMLLTPISVLAALPALALGAYVQRNNYTALFSAGLSPGASIYFPSQADYNQSVTQRFSTFADPTFKFTIKAATEEDVQFIVKTAHAHDISFFATGGGHSSEVKLGKVHDIVNIDLSNLNTTSLDASTNLLTIGPGVNFGDVLEPLYAAGKQIQTGNAPCVNFVGATVGAGVGPLQGKYGLIIDALRSVRLVTASGDVVTASFEENPDLFWAVRGAGANFGIITSAVYEVHNAVNDNQVISADFQFHPESNRSLWEVLASWDNDYPQEMGMSIASSYNHSNGQPLLLASVAFLGTQEQAQPYLDRLIDLDPMRWRNLSVGWDQLIYVAGFGNYRQACTGGTYSNHFSIGSRRADVDTLTRIYGDVAAFSSARPWFAGSFIIQRYSSAAAQAVPVDRRGVYPWRDIEMEMTFENVYDGPEHDKEVFAYSRQGRSKLQAASGFDEMQVYLNYGFGDEGPEVWYGRDNLPRLSALKKTWDPENRFGPGNPVPLP